MMKSAKIIIFTLLFSLLFVVFTRNTLAFSSGANLDYQLNYWRAIDSSEMNLQSFVNETFKGLAASLVNQAVGCMTCSSNKPKKFGLMGDVSNIIPTLYTSLPTSKEYLTDIGLRLNIVPSTYAQEQGMGFERLRSFLPVWKVFRNLSYALLAIVSVLIGFAIMFRVKLSPQASVTIQTALPRIVIVLVLITFSYAIVGFLVDIMFVVSNLILSLFSEYLIFHPTNLPITDNFSLIGTMMNIGLNALLFPFIIAILGGVLSVISFAIPGVGAGGMLGLLAILIFAIIFLLALIRILFMLAKSYVNVALGLIFAPMILIAGAIPSINTIGPWIQNIVSNLLIFPVVLSLTVVAGFISMAGVGILLDPLTKFTNSGTPWDELVKTVTPLISGTQSPVDAALLFFVAPGILLLTPKAGDIIQSFISKKPFAYGTAIGEAMSIPKSVKAAGVSYSEKMIQRDGTQKIIGEGLKFFLKS